MADNIEVYELQLVSSPQNQQATADVNALQNALAGTVDQTVALAAAGADLAGVLPFDKMADDANQALIPLEQLTEQTDELDFSVRSLADHYDAAAVAMQNAANNVPDLNNVSGGDEGDDSGGGINPRVLSTAGRLIGGDVGHGLRAAGQVTRLADSLPEDAAALAELGTTGLVAAPALIAAGVAFKAFNDDIQKDKDNLAAAITGVDAYYSAIGKGDTTAQATQELAALNRQRDAEAQELAQLQAAEASTFQQAQQSYGDLGARLSDTQTPVAQLRGEIEKLQPQVANDTATIDGLSRAIQNNAFAAQDAANITQNIADQRLKDANEAEGMTSQQRQDRIRAISDEIDNIETIRKGAPADVYNSFNPEIDNLKQERDDLNKYAQTLADVLARQAEADKLLIGYSQDEVEADKMTAAQRKQRIDDIHTELDADEKLINEGGLSAVATKQVSDQMTALSGEATILGGVLESTADKAAKAAAQTDQASRYLDALKEEGSIRDQITQDTLAMNQAASQELAAEGQAEADLQDKLGDILAKGAEQQQQITQQNTDAVNKILRDGGEAEREDIGNRDAEKFQQDALHEQDQLADQSLHYTEAEQQLQQSLTDQENAAKKSEDKQIQQLQSGLQQQEATLNTHLQQDQVNLQNVLAEENTLATYSSGQIVEVHENMWLSMLNTAEQIAPQILGTLIGALTGNPNFSGSPLPPVSGSPINKPRYQDDLVNHTTNNVLNVLAGVIERM